MEEKDFSISSINSSSAENVEDTENIEDADIAAAKTLLSDENISGEANIMGNAEKNRLLTRGQRLLNLYNLGAVDILMNSERRTFRERAKNLDYAFARKGLEELPYWAKNMQNRIFTKLATDNKAETKFINSVVTPELQDRLPGERLLWCMFGEDVAPNLDYITKFTEKDAEGNYVLSNETFATFVEWYHHQAAKLEKEVASDAEKFESKYVQGVDQAVKKGVLPSSFAENAKRLDANSASYQKPRYCLADYSSLDNIDFVGACYDSFYSDFSDVIWLKMSDYTDGTINYYVAGHEDTHYISGTGIFFGHNKEARRIIDEAITETATSAITRAYKDSRSDEGHCLDNYVFGDGEAYDTEREVLKYLQSGGQIEIDPKMFFDAYTEKDERIAHAIESGSDFEKWYNDREASKNPENYYYVDMGNMKRDRRSFGKSLRKYAIDEQIYGPKVTALYEALYQAFPDCKTPADLGTLIIKSFNEIRQQSVTE